MEVFKNQIVTYILEDGTIHKGRVFRAGNSKVKRLITIYNYVLNKYHQVWDRDVSPLYSDTPETHRNGPRIKVLEKEVS